MIRLLILFVSMEACFGQSLGLAQSILLVESKCRLDSGELMECKLTEGEAKLQGEQGYLRTARVRSGIILQSFVEYKSGAFMARKNNHDWEEVLVSCENIETEPWRMQVYTGRNGHLFSIGAECGE